MANISIPNLPSQSATTDLDLLVIVNSGETTTSKITISDLFSGNTTPPGFIQGDASQSLVPYYFPTSAATIADTTYVDKLFVDGGEIYTPNDNIVISSTSLTKTLNGSSHIIAGGEGNNITTNGKGQVILGGLNNTKTSAGLNNNSDVLIGGQSNQLLGQCFRGVMIGGQLNIANSAKQGGIIGGQSNNMQASTNNSFIIGGTTNTILNAIDNSIILGGENITATTSNTTYVDKLFVDGGDIKATDNDIIVNSPSSEINNTGSFNTIFGGSGNEIRSASSGYNTIIGSLNVDATSNFGASAFASRIANVAGFFCGAYSTSEATITNGRTSVILGGENITLNGDYSVSIGGRFNTINNHTRSVILGGLSQTSQYNNTAHAQHLLSTGQINNGYFDNGSGSTFTIDWDSGNSQKVYMTGDTSLDFTNVRNGAQYRLQVVNGGTHSITGATASGYTILCEGGSIPNITNNGVDLCVIEVMGTDILVRHFADFSAP